MVRKQSLNTSVMKTYKRKLKIRSFLDHWKVVAVMTVLTIYALFFDDLRVISFSKESDNYFYGVTLMVLITFMIEICLGSYANPGYVGSFFFYIDILSTVTMVSDCGWIWDHIIDGGQDSSSASDLAKTTRASRVVRVIRIFRFIRLVRIAKLYK
jgi:hypothetical protein